MTIFGDCVRLCGREATHAVVFKDGRFQAANDRLGSDMMTVAFGDIVFCAECAAAVAVRINDEPPTVGVECDICGGPASFVVSGNDRGLKCSGHVEKYRRGRASLFYTVEEISSSGRAQ